MLVPNVEQQAMVHEVIYQELCLGQISQHSKQKYLAVIQDLFNQGAQAVILGCTEITLLVQQKDTTVPLYDTTAIHAQSAVAAALGKV